MSRQDEDRVAGYLRSLGLDAIRFGKEEMNDRTPDFRLYAATSLVGYCEVKSSSPLDEGISHDPTFNRLSGDIHQGANQLSSVNPNRDAMNILAFVNHEVAIDERDLIAVFTGNFYGERGVAHPIYRKYSHGRIRAEKFLVDAYLWFQDGEDTPHTLFNMSDSERFAKTCSLFQVESDDVFVHD